MDNMESLSAVMGEDKAKKVIKLASNYDKYIEKFKNEMNSLLDSSGFEVKTGIAFIQKQIPKNLNDMEKANGTKNIISDSSKRTRKER